MITELADTLQEQYASIQIPLAGMQQTIEGIDSRVATLEGMQKTGRSMGIGPVKVHKPYDRPTGTDVTRATGESVASQHGLT